MPRTAEQNGYRKIADHLRERIRSGQLPPNSLLPGRTALAREYDVARRTVDRAVHCLVDEGMLAASSRRGTFVQSPANTGEPASVPATFSATDPRGSVSPSLLDRTVGVVCSLDAARAGQRYPAGREPWDLTILAEIEAACSTLGGRTCVASLPGLTAPDAAEIAVGDALSGGAEVIVCIQLYDSPELHEQMRRAVAASGVPGVFVVSRDLPEPVPHVFPDQFYAGHQAAQHLVAAGYSRVLFLAAIAAPWVTERIAGARSALSRAGLPADALVVAPSRDAGRIDATKRPSERAVLGAARELARRLLSGPRSGPDLSGRWAVIAANDIVGFGVLDELEHLGRLPGRDLGVIAFDDNPDSRRRGMSSLRMPLHQIGRAALELAAGVLAGEPRSPQVRVLWQLAARASTARGIKS